MQNQLLKIKLNKSSFAHNEPISGSILFETYEPLKLFSLELILLTQKKIYLNGKETTDSENKKIIKELFNWKESEKISSGKHIFPFEIFLNKEGQISFSDIIYFKNNRAEIQIENYLIAKLRIRDSIKILSCEWPVKIFYAEKIDLKTISQMKLRSCFSFFASSIYFITQLNKKIYKSREKIKFTIEVKSRKTIDISGIDFYLVKMVDLTAENKTYSMRTVELKRSNNSFLNGGEMVIELPPHLHSSVKHENLRIFYFLQIEIHMVNLYAFSIKIPINIYNREKMSIDCKSLYLLKGIKFPISYINL